MNDTQSTPHSFRPKHISWLTIALALLTVVTFIAVSNTTRRYYDYAVPMATRGTAVMESGSAASAPSQNKVAPDMYYPNPYPYPTPDVPVTDTREFLKVYYNATMRTRDVQGLTRRVETTVRGFSGRIDQESSSSEYGSVSFAVPQSKYDAFRTELESLVGSRFLTTNISSQNLLPQKLSIEEQQKQADATLANYRTERQRIVAAHTNTVQMLQSKINDATEEGSVALLTQQLANENASYLVQLQNADRNIQSAQEWQKAVRTQDQELLNNVATVTGTVSIQWISWWNIALLYLPGYWIPALFAALTCLSFLWDRRRYGTV